LLCCLEGQYVVDVVDVLTDQRGKPAAIGPEDVVR
jgi:hypothetical protein